MANVSATDKVTGVYSLTEPGYTSQGPATQFNGAAGYFAEKTNIDNLSFPSKAALPPPTGYSSWEDAYYNGFLK